MKLRLGLPKGTIKEVVLHDESGTRLETKTGSTSWSGSQTTMELVYEGKFPPTGKIVVTVYDQLQKFKIPFELNNLSLFGREL